MEIKQLKLVYFSPTGTTQKILESIAQGLGIDPIEHLNLTLPVGDRQSVPFSSEDLVILGAPVYGGRIPAEARQRFMQVRANKAPAILVVVYGNRAFEDALLELQNLALELGFTPVAGGAFIGEHSFATKAIPIANGRPDSQDVQKARAFGANIKKKILDLPSSAIPRHLNLPGSFPYEAQGARAMAVAPLTKEEACIVCGTCARLCPTAAITIDNKAVITDPNVCIRCCACIKQCSAGARIMSDPAWLTIANWLNEHCTSRKEPQVFGVEW